LIADHPVAVVDLQLVAQQGREAQLAHQRLGELVEGVGEDHHLEALAQPVDEFHRPLQRLQGGDHLLDVAQLQAMFVEDAQTLLHQHVVVRNVPGGRLQGVDTGFFRERDPDFRNQHAFQVKTGNFHRTLLEIL
jgi:aminoglycoside phosphotransferase family enzyme